MVSSHLLTLRLSRALNTDMQLLLDAHSVSSNRWPVLTSSCSTRVRLWAPLAFHQIKLQHWLASSTGYRFSQPSICSSDSAANHSYGHSVSVLLPCLLAWESVKLWLATVRILHYWTLLPNHSLLSFWCFSLCCSSFLWVQSSGSIFQKSWQKRVSALELVSTRLPQYSSLSSLQHWLKLSGRTTWAVVDYLLCAEDSQLCAEFSVSLLSERPRASPIRRYSPFTQRRRMWSELRSNVPLICS